MACSVTGCSGRFLGMDELMPPVISLQVTDPKALSAAIRNADLNPCQLSAKPLPSSINRVSCADVCLDFAAFGPAVLFSGCMPGDSYTLVFVTACPEKGRCFNFGTEYTDGYMGFFPPGGVMDVYTPEGYENATLTVAAPLFLAAVETSFPEIPDAVLRRGAGMRIGSAEQAMLRGLLSAVMECIENRTAPLEGKLARSHLEKSLLDAFLSALRSGCSSLVAGPGRRIEGRLRRLRQVRDYVAGSLHGPMQLDDLCRSVGLSRRGVELLFQDSLGIGPNAFIRQQRLQGVRRALQSATPASGVVKQTAMEWGFLHMGHFASSYRMLFGESPSSTLKRQRSHRAMAPS